MTNTKDPISHEEPEDMKVGPHVPKLLLTTVQCPFVSTNNPSVINLPTVRTFFF